MTAAAPRTSLADGDLRTPPDLRLTARYRWLLLAVTLPLFIVITVLAASQYRDQQAAVLRSLAQNSASYAIALEGIAKAASDHVLQMKLWTEEYLTSPHDHPSDLRKYFTPYFVNGEIDSYTLDRVPAERRRSIGQLFWLHGDPHSADVGPSVIDQALEFFVLARLTHEVTPYLRWSYFFPNTRDFFSLYPWESSAEVLTHLGATGMRSGILKYYEYDFYKAGTPERNPRRQPYWTAPYVDAAGAGAMVTHGAPVYVRDKFSGIVATDVRLATLGEFLRGLPHAVGRLLIFDDKDMVLADSADTSIDALRNGAQITPAILHDQTVRATLQEGGEPVKVHGYVMMAHVATHAPWTLVYLVSEKEIAELLLPRLRPYGVILAVLAATVFTALYLLRREFIGPALALVHYIREASRDASISEPQLPRLWQTWVGIVSRAFAENRDATRRLRESEERLQQILNNSSAVVYVRSRDERFLLVNRACERVLGITQDQLVGKQLEEVFPSHTAAQFRANDMRVIEQNSVIEFEEHVTLKDGVHTYISSKFPLFDTNGDIYAICGISTDITRRKQTEDLLRQAALGISEAQGDEVFNSLVSHLSRAMGVDVTFIGALEQQDRIRTRALCVRQCIESEVTFALQGSACESVVGRQFRFYRDGVRHRFPDDALLRGTTMESFAALPLFDSAGEDLGVLAVMQSEPLQDPALVESILQIFAGRAASELERERADAALRASEASYRAIFEASEDAIFVHDLDTGAILDVSRKACEIYGYTHDEMLALDIGALSSGIPPYNQEGANRLLVRAIAGERLCFEWHRRNRDGSLHWDEVFARRASIGGQDRILAFTREITARKEAEQMLRASEQQYREANRRLRESEAFKSAVVENALLGVITIDSSDRIVEFNPASVAMFGHDKERAIGSDLAELLLPARFRSRSPAGAGTLSHHRRGAHARQAAGAVGAARRRHRVSHGAFHIRQPHRRYHLLHGVHCRPDRQGSGTGGAACQRRAVPVDLQCDR